MRELAYPAVIAAIFFISSCGAPPPLGDDDDDDVPGDPSLSSLEVIDTSDDSVLELTPAFDSAVLDYTASVEGNRVLQVRGTTTQPVFSLSVNGSSPDYLDDSTFETNFTNLIAPVDITVGVVSEDGSSLVYSVSVGSTR